MGTVEEKLKEAYETLNTLNKTELDEVLNNTKKLTSALAEAEAFWTKEKLYEKQKANQIN